MSEQLEALSNRELDAVVAKEQSEAKVTHLEREIERLREALGRIQELSQERQLGETGVALSRVKYVCRAALHPTPEPEEGD